MEENNNIIRPADYIFKITMATALPDSKDVEEIFKDILQMFHEKHLLNDLKHLEIVNVKLVALDGLPVNTTKN